MLDDKKESLNRIDLSVGLRFNLGKNEGLSRSSTTTIYYYNAESGEGIDEFKLIVACWFDLFKEESLADAIMGRIVHIEVKDSYIFTFRKSANPQTSTSFLIG